MADDKKATDGADKANQNQQGQEQKETKPNEPKVITMTEEELEKRLQSESDRRVAEALKTHSAKINKEVAERIQKEREEATRLAQMSEEEKRAELDRKREQQLSEREQSIHKKEMTLEAVKILDEKGLPVSFAETLIGDNAEDTMARIGKFEKEWNAALDKRIADRLKGKAPQADQTKPGKLDMNAIIRRQARRY